MKRCRYRIGRIIFCILLLVVIVVGVILFINRDKTSKEDLNIKNIIDSMQKEEAKLDKVRIYGTHLNFSGELNKRIYLDNVDDAKIIFKNINDGKDIKVDIEYDVNREGHLTFYTSDKINEGIDLEGLSIGNYIITLKLSEKNYNTNKNDINYYKIINDDDTKKFTYYTITKNDKNNKITINNYNKNIQEKKYSYMKVDIEDTKLPSNVYDITIDPGHGGLDGGAVVDGYSEKDITLEYGLLLKEKLEELGLKVKLTRDGTNEEELDIYDMYGDNGRAVIPNKVKSKYAFSIHLNSAEYDLNTGGVEIYVPNNTNVDLARLLVQNIVECANTNYSPSSAYKIEDGLYLRTFSYYDIEASNEQARKDGYEPYDLTTDTTYYFFIRETGGLNTNAYVDGRNPLYEKNKYYNSPIGVESYLVELGFMVSDSDLNNIINNKDGYVDAFVKTMEEYLNKYE